jgi:hypothetical protein
MATKRLTIELSIDHYEILRRQAGTTGTTISGLIRRLIDDPRFRPMKETRRNYQDDPLFKSGGSFDGPKDLAEHHDHYLY